MEADFSGYATKAGLKCSDGRTIMPDAFKHQDQKTVPLVWAHCHNTPSNVLGHAILENREDGVYAYGFFNDTEQAKNSKLLVQHKDVVALSIFANQLVEKSNNVLHGTIRELSLVLSGANPGALIDFVNVAHSDGEVETLGDEAVIYTGLALEHSSPPDEKSEEEEDEVKTETPEGDTEDQTEEKEAMPEVKHADERTLQDVIDSMSPEQQDVLYHMVAIAAEDGGSTATHSAIDPEELSQMMHNVFEQNGAKKPAPTLSHDQLKTIAEDAQKLGSYKESFLQHAVEYGIEDIDILFPDAQSVTSSPELISRRMEWVADVINGTKHSPFSRIKSTAADLTAEEARAKGYVKGNKKKDEIIKLLKRVTTPTTIYKKQKLDRDDIVDITDLDVVAWLKAEMRLMLDEELARAVLIGDGREPDDEDKIDEDHIRPIAYDDDMYAHKVNIPSNVAPDEIVESIIRAQSAYKGTGRPTLYTTDGVLIDMLLIKDKMGRRIYGNEQDLAAALRVAKIVPAEVLESTPDLLCVIVNLVDYTLGADRGGNVSMFDDFDIDYNQYKYLIETRVSGALTKPKSAVVVRREAGTTVTPTAPTYDAVTHTLTIPAQAGVVYRIDGVTQTSGDQVIDESTDVEAFPDTGYAFPHNTNSDWTFIYTP